MSNEISKRQLMRWAKAQNRWAKKLAKNRTMPIDLSRLRRNLKAKLVEYLGEPPYRGGWKPAIKPTNNSRRYIYSLYEALEQCDALESLMKDAPGRRIAATGIRLGWLLNVSDAESGRKQRSRAQNARRNEPEDDEFVKEYIKTRSEYKGLKHTAVCNVVARKRIAGEIAKQRAEAQRNSSAWREKIDKDEMRKRSQALVKRIGRAVDRHYKKTGTLVRLSTPKHP